MRLTTERLELRPVNRQDGDALHALFRRPEVRRYLWDDVIVPRRTVAELIAASVESFARHGFGQWGVFLNASPTELIGCCGLRFFGEPAAVEILYALLPEFWRQGLATEAAREVLRHGFTGVGLDAIHAGADPPNRSSFRVMERLGMRFERRLEIGGQPADYYVLQRHEFAAAER